MSDESGWFRYFFKEMDPGLRWLAILGFTCAIVGCTATIVGTILGSSR